MDDSFLPSHEYPGYLVSASGEVMHERLGRLVKPKINNYGTVMVQIKHPKNYGYTHVPLARVVADVYSVKHSPTLGNAFPPDVVLHKNMDRSDCRAENLVWRYRFYAMKYHRLPDHPSWMNPFHPGSQGENTSYFNAPIIETNSSLRGEPGLSTFATMFGLLPSSIWLAAQINTPGTDYNRDYLSIREVYGPHVRGPVWGNILSSPAMMYSFWLMNHYGKGLNFVFEK